MKQAVSAKGNIKNRVDPKNDALNLKFTSAEAVMKKIRIPVIKGNIKRQRLDLKGKKDNQHPNLSKKSTKSV